MICITEKCHWYLSNRGFARAIDQILDALAVSQACPSLFAYLNDPQGMPQLIGDLDLYKLPEEERAAFLEATRQVCQRLEDQDPVAWNYPLGESPLEFREHMLDLVSLVESPRDTRPDPDQPRDPGKRPNQRPDAA